MKELNDFLKQNRPIVRDDPTFSLETLKRLESVEGIKQDMDRHYKSVRIVFLVAVLSGLAVGITLITAGIFLPTGIQSFVSDISSRIQPFLYGWGLFIWPIVSLLIVFILFVILRRKESIL